ncbi:hypothetical protein, partial [Bacillus safensis]|uniref:hypothetical protein n=1 Tax=Bacillus safensis TaxID=561879 RepID=UPI00364E6E60
MQRKLTPRVKAQMLDLSVEAIMAPMFKAMGGPTVAASFGSVPNSVKLYDTATPEGIVDLYEEAERAARMSRSSFL